MVEVFLDLGIVWALYNISVETARLGGNVQDYAGAVKL